MDKQKIIFIVNWEWYVFCEILFLNSDVWVKFVFDYMLEEGDVCVFEFFNIEFVFMMGFFFCVYIFCVVDQIFVKVDVSLSYGWFYYCSQILFNNM